MPDAIDAMSPADRRKQAERLLDRIRDHYDALTNRERQLWNQMWTHDWCSREQLEMLQMTLERFQ